MKGLISHFICLLRWIKSPEIDASMLFTFAARNWQGMSITYIDETYVPTVSLVVEMLPAPAPVHVPREHWGLSLCKRHRGGHRVVCWGRDRGTRRAAIYGRIRCIGSVGSF